MKDPKSTSFFHCGYDDLQSRLACINPHDYDKTRNFLDGAVTWLSPFITHGIINTRDVANAVLSRHAKPKCEKLLFELAWREYFHRIWQNNRDAIFSDLKNPSVSTRMQLPSSLLNCQTGINVIDESLQQLQQIGSMHNHARMWVASICCNMGNTHWLPAAKWMHYHLLDGDLASNTLSWQWIAGTFSNKRYFANQDNINKFSKSSQHGTFLDVPYEAFENWQIPGVLAETDSPDLQQTLPFEALKNIEPISESVALRSVWHLQKEWQPTATHQWIFVDTEQQAQWPMSYKRWSFIKHWASFIPGVRFVKGTSQELAKKLGAADVLRQEYTGCNHWSPQTEERQWLYPDPPKPYNSFSKFWKQVKNDD